MFDNRQVAQDVCFKFQCGSTEIRPDRTPAQVIALFKFQCGSTEIAAGNTQLRLYAFFKFQCGSTEI